MVKEARISSSIVGPNRSVPFKFYQRSSEISPEGETRKDRGGIKRNERNRASKIIRAWRVVCRGTCVILSIELHDGTGGRGGSNLSLLKQDRLFLRSTRPLSHQSKARPIAPSIPIIDSPYDFFSFVNDEANIHSRSSNIDRRRFPFDSSSRKKKGSFKRTRTWIVVNYIVSPSWKQPVVENIKVCRDNNRNRCR